MSISRSELNKKIIILNSFSLKSNSTVDFIEIKMDNNNLWSAFKHNVNVEYSYPTKYGNMYGDSRIIDIKNDLIQFGKYKLKLDRFDYLKIKHIYKNSYNSSYG